MNCISCSIKHEEKFCPNCGERKGVERITISSIIQSTFSTITNMDKGFLYNVKTLFLEPKLITTDYINGKRKGILNPISYLIFSITIYLVILSIFKAPKSPESVNVISETGIRRVSYEIGYFLHKYIKYLWIFSIIPLGISLKLVFRKYNFPEYIAVSSFVIAQATIIGIFSYLLFRIPLILDPIVFASIFVLIFRIFKKDKDIIELSLVTLAACILFFIQWVVIIIAIGVMKA